MIDPTNSAAEIWTAVFTGLTVLVMTIGVIQTRMLIRLGLAPLVPEVSLTRNANGVISLGVPRDSRYRIASVSISPRQSSLQRYEPTGAIDSFGTQIFEGTGPWSNRINSKHPTDRLSLMTRKPRTGVLRVKLKADMLPSRTATVPIEDW